MISAVLAFITALPALINGVEAFQKNYYDKVVRLTAIRVGGDVDVAKAVVSGVVVEGQTKVAFLQTVASSKFLMYLIAGFALPVMIFMAKCILWDTMLGLGTTDPIKGEVAVWANIVITGLFGSGTVMGAASMYFNRKNQ